jgi:hypothetical protein
MKGLMRKPAGRNDGGFVLVWALLLMVVLLILGVSGIGTSVFESMMTANDALHKQSFFQADGGANVAAMLIEENISCPIGFTSNFTGATTAIPTSAAPLIVVEPAPHLALYRNTTPVPLITDANRDAYYFYNAADSGGTTLPHTNIKTGGTVVIIPGGPRNIGSGYEGLPKNQASARNYDTYAQYFNNRQSQSIVQIMWQHVNGLEGTCNF